VGTVRSRLASGRERLRVRLARRGLASLAVPLSSLLGREAAGAFPSGLLESTVKTVMKSATDPSVVGLVVSSFTGLVEGIGAAMFVTKVKLLVAAGLLLGAGAVVWAYQAKEGAGESPVDSGGTSRPSENGPAHEAQSEISLGRETDDAIARLESLSRRLADALVKAERSETVAATAEELRSLRENGLPAIHKTTEKLGAMLKSMERRVSGSPRKTRDETKPAAEPRRGVEAIKAALERSIPMQFANETPLEDFLKYVTTATKSPELPNGIPIYLDPVGLQEAEKTSASPVTIDLKDVPLKTTLRFALAQLGLGFEITNSNCLIVTGENSTGTLTTVPIDEIDTPLNDLQRKAERGELSADGIAKLTDQLKAIRELRKIQLELDKLPQRAFH
jgi:hypothetical protein